MGKGMLSSRATLRSSEPEPLWDRPLGARAKFVQALNRITFGPRPGDLARVQSMGIETFIGEQLHPERLDDAGIDARLAALPTLSMTTSQLMEKYPAPTQLASQQPEAMRGSGPGSAATAQDSVREVLVELAREEVLRAVYSERQLQELVVQFWMNHFNVFAGKGPDKWMLTSFERDTIRPRALGRFEDLLVATAQSPAMQFYLDNWLSSAPVPAESDIAGQIGSDVAPNQLRRGLNENYGRELMELHTLGVNGGYTQQDVIEVSRCLTGWTLRRPRREPEFFFDPRLHDQAPKTVLGHYIAAGGGFGDGLQVLHILAAHPSTARFISTKLCRRFVADDPPATLVERCSREFLSTNGDLRAVLESILTSPEFYSEGAYRAKMKSPLEVVASALRALGAETDAGMPLLGFMGRMGEPMFQLQAPSGFPDRASTWASSSSLLARLNFATMLAANRIHGTEINWSRAVPQRPAQALDELSRALIGAPLSAGSRQAILNGLDQVPSASRAMPPGDSAATLDHSRSSFPELAALVIGSPDFQRR